MSDDLPQDQAGGRRGVALPADDEPAPTRGARGEERGPDHGPSLSRRTLLLGGAAALTAGAGATAWWLAGDTETSPPQPAEPTRSLPANTSQPTGEDATRELQALLDEGSGRVTVPPGTHVISSTLTVPWAVHTLELPAGAVLHMRGDEIAVRRSGRVEERVRDVVRAVEGENQVTLDVEGLDVGSWLYLCADDWVKFEKSKVGMLRRVTALDGDVVTVDKALIRSLTRAPRAHLVELAPAFELVGGGAIENGDPQGTNANLVRLDFVDGIEVSGIELRECGSAALRTFGTVGGRIDCYIHDCVDDPKGGHFGYGVSCSSATRDLVVAGVIERVRHAFTTDHGYDAPLESMAITGEPEDIRVEPVVRDTTSTGLDTHEPGYGITMVPDVTNGGTTRWGGVNIRARNVTVQGGRVVDSNAWGILVSPSASGTIIRGVEVAGVRKGRGVDCRADTRIVGGSISGFGGSMGLDVRENVAVSMEETVIDGGGSLKARGVVLGGDGCALEGTVRGCGIGVLHTPTAGENEVDLTFEDVAREQVGGGP